LRNFKKDQYESSLETAAADLMGEPDWVVQQMLRRKRDELLRKWEDREQRSERIRANEKQLEERASKRRRREEPDIRSKSRDIDEDAEFLLNWDEGEAVDEDDPLSSISKETRALLERVGLAPSRKKPEEDQEEAEDEIKVGRLAAHTGYSC